MLRRSRALLLSLLIITPTFGLQAEEQAGLTLSPPLQEALAQEMIAIQNNMMQMMPAIASGNWGRVAQLAKQIEGAYIMRQQLSAAQMEELHRKLPPEFIALDHDFHRMAGMLAHVAEEPHVELISFYYYRLTDSCISCHSKFATGRFTELAHSSAEHSHEEVKEAPMQERQHEHNPEHHH